MKSQNKEILYKPRNFKSYWLFYLQSQNFIHKEGIKNFKHISKQIFIKEEKYVLEKAILDNIDDFGITGKIKDFMIQFENLMKDKNIDLNFAYDNIKKIISVFENEIVILVKKKDMKSNNNIIVRFLNNIFPFLKLYLEKPKESYVIKLKNLLIRNLKTKYNNKIEFTKLFITFLKKNFINPINDLILTIKKTVETHSKKLFDFNKENFNKNNKNENIKGLILNKIPENIFNKQVEKFKKAKLCQNYLKSILRELEYKEILKNIEKDFFSLEVPEIHKTYLFLTKSILSPSIEYHEKINIFLKNYFEFIKEENNYEKILERLENLNNLIAIPIKKFLIDMKNIDSLVTFDEIENLKKFRKFKILFDYHIKEKINLKNENLKEILKLKTEFDNEKNSIKKTSKKILKLILENKIIIPKEIKTFIAPCFKIYQTKNCFNKIENLYLKDLKIKINNIDQKFVNPFNYSKLILLCQDGEKFYNENLKKYENIEYIEEFLNNYDELLIKSKKEKLKFSILENLKRNLEFAQDLNYLVNRNYELDNIILKKIDFEKIKKFILERTNLENLERLMVYKNDNFMISGLNDIKKLVINCYYEKLFSNNKENQIMINIFINENFIKSIQKNEKLKINFMILRNDYVEFNKKINSFFLYIIQNFDLINNIENILFKINEILDFSNKFFLDIEEYKEICFYLYKMRLPIFLIYNCQNFLKNLKNENGRELINKKHNIYKYIYLKVFNALCIWDLWYSAI